MTVMPYGQNLNTLVGMADRLKQIEKTSIHSGDWICVQTGNSVYSIRAVGDGYFQISGGWFDRKGLSPSNLRINGCTWGGSAIKTDIAAACGLCMEIGLPAGERKKRLVTSPIRKIFFIPATSLN